MSILDYLDWRHIFNKFSSPYSPFEEKLFSDVSTYLDKDRREVFLSNLKEVNRRSWGFEGSEAWYYKIEYFKISTSREMYFKSKAEDEKLFTGVIILNQENIRFNIFTFRQKFSHVTFSSDPRRFKKNTSFLVKKH